MRQSFGAPGERSQRKIDLNRMVVAQGVSSSVLRLLSRSAQVMVFLGLQYNRPFHRDAAFLLLLALGPIVWFSMIEVFPFQPLPRHRIWSPAFLSVTLWQPLFEELLFRGIVQGYLLQSTARQKTWIGLSTSNLLTSLLFSLAHLAGHSVSWSLLVFVPSLCFGFVRDRFGSVYPSIALHVFYNAGYFLLIGGLTLPNSF
ncbi:MAG TPA: JDVT-CTERM system glutamic-type intramembrane protease [Nitrospira sp.]|nr:JDVT-CTERM system glutamic-type intramembrane protease [Nitrospira sp.]